MNLTMRHEPHDARETRGKDHPVLLRSDAKYDLGSEPLGGGEEREENVLLLLFRVDDALHSRAVLPVGIVADWVLFGNVCVL